ncbi:hypothetical protein D3C78_846080 [compost metagenome]
MPGIAIKTGSIRIFHRQQNLCCRPAKPCDPRQRAGNGKAKTIGIARALRKTCGMHIPPPYIQRINGTGDSHSLFKNVDCPFARNPLAARHTIRVYDESFKYFDIGVIGEKFLCVFNIIHHAPASRFHLVSRAAKVANENRPAADR